MRSAEDLGLVFDVAVAEAQMSPGYLRCAPYFLLGEQIRARSLLRQLDGVASWPLENATEEANQAVIPATLRFS